MQAADDEGKGEGQGESAEVGRRPSLQAATARLIGSTEASSCQVREPLAWDCGLAHWRRKGFGAFWEWLRIRV